MADEYQRRKHPLEQQSIRDAVALNNAVSFCTKGIDDVLNVLGIAEVFRGWLNTVSQDKPVETSTDVQFSITYPTPTLDQKVVLDEVVKRSGKPISEVYPAVLDWVKKTYNADQYPQLTSSITPFLEWVGWN